MIIYVGNPKEIAKKILEQMSLEGCRIKGNSKKFHFKSTSYKPKIVNQIKKYHLTILSKNKDKFTTKCLEQVDSKKKKKIRKIKNLNKWRNRPW